MNPLRSACGRSPVRWLAIGLGVLAAASPAFAVQPRTADGLAHKEFFRPELYISVSHEDLDKVITALPNKAAWESFVAGRSGAVRVYIDPRSGAATNIIGATPLLPGSGVGNNVTLGTLSRQLGRNVEQVDQEVVAAAVLGYVRAHQDVLGIDVSQLGAVRATQVTRDLWQIHIPQQRNGIPVRDGRLAASISHGNLVVIGTETWGNVAIDTAAAIPAEAALAAGFAYAEGPTAEDTIVSKPTLEIAPIAPREYQQGEGFAGPVGRGYQHRLVWTFVFQRLPDDARWEVLVDALSGEVLAFQDINHYADFKGGVYPVTNNEICPIPGRCGIMQPGFPMPFADTGFPAPNNFTNSAGVYSWPGGTATTTLNGPPRPDHRHLRADQRILGHRLHRPRRDQRPARLHDAGHRRDRQHRFLALRLLRGQQDHGDGSGLPARQRLGVDVPDSHQREPQLDLQRVLQHRQRQHQLLPHGRRLPEHRRDGGRVRPRMGPCLRRQRRQRRPQQLQRGLRRHRRHLPLPGLLCRPRLLVDLQHRLQPDPGRHGQQREREPARRHALRDGLLGRARCRLGQALRQPPRHRARLRLQQLPDQLGPLRPAGPLRGGSPAPGGLGPRRARPRRAAVQPRHPDEVHHRQQAVLPGQRQHRALVRVHLRRDVQRLRRDQRLHAVDHRR